VTELGILRPNAVIHAWCVGSLLLLLGLLSTRWLTSPYLRLPIAAWSIRSALIAVVTGLLPVGIAIPVPLPAWNWGKDAMSSTLAETSTVVSVESSKGDFTRPQAEQNSFSEIAAATTQSAQSQDESSNHTLREEPVVPLPEWNAVATVPPASRGSEVASTTAASDPIAVNVLPATWNIDRFIHGLIDLYILAVILLHGQLLFAHLGLFRLRYAAKPAPAPVNQLLAEIAGAERRVPELKVSPRIHSPICFGLWRPVIVLPDDMIQIPESELRWVLAHELDHLRRGDPWMLLWLGMCRAWFFLLPWFWPLRHELTLCQEQLADAAAASTAGRAVDYAAFLVQLSQSYFSRPRAIVLAANDVRAVQSDLYRRVIMLLKMGEMQPRRRLGQWSAIAAGGMVSTALILSSLEFAAADDPPRPKAEQKQPGKPEEKPSDKPRPEAKQPPGPPRGPRDGEGSPRGPRDDDDRPGLFRPYPPGEFRKLLEKLDKAARDGNIEEVRELMDRLRDSMRLPGPPRGERPRDGETPPRAEKPRDGERPFFPPMPPFFERFGPDSDAIREARKALEQAIENLKGDPKARAEVQKAFENFRRAMDEFGRGFVPPRRPGFEGRPGPEGRPGFEGRPGPRLGLALAPAPDFLAEQLDLPQNVGLIINDVMPDSPAEQAGFKKNDVLVKVAGKDVPADPRKLVEMIQELSRKSATVEFSIIRRGKEKTLTAKLPQPSREEKSKEGRDRDDRDDKKRSKPNA